MRLSEFLGSDPNDVGKNDSSFPGLTYTFGDLERLSMPGVTTQSSSYEEAVSNVYQSLEAQRVNLMFSLDMLILLDAALSGDISPKHFGDMISDALGIDRNERLRITKNIDYRQSLSGLGPRLVVDWSNLSTTGNENTTLKFYFYPFYNRPTALHPHPTNGWTLLTCYPYSTSLAPGDNYVITYDPQDVYLDGVQADPTDYVDSVIADVSDGLSSLDSMLSLFNLAGASVSIPTESFERLISNLPDCDFKTWIAEQTFFNAEFSPQDLTGISVAYLAANVPEDVNIEGSASLAQLSLRKQHVWNPNVWASVMPIVLEAGVAVLSIAAGAIGVAFYLGFQIISSVVTQLGNISESICTVKEGIPISNLSGYIYAVGGRMDRLFPSLFANPVNTTVLTSIYDQLVNYGSTVLRNGHAYYYVSLRTTVDVGDITYIADIVKSLDVAVQVICPCGAVPNVNPLFSIEWDNSTPPGEWWLTYGSGYSPSTAPSSGIIDNSMSEKEPSTSSQDSIKRKVVSALTQLITPSAQYRGGSAGNVATPRLSNVFTSLSRFRWSVLAKILEGGDAFVSTPSPEDVVSTVINICWYWVFSPSEWDEVSWDDIMSYREWIVSVAPSLTTSGGANFLQPSDAEVTIVGYHSVIEANYILPTFSDKSRKVALSAVLAVSAGALALKLGGKAMKKKALGRLVTREAQYNAAKSAYAKDSSPANLNSLRKANRRFERATTRARRLGVWTPGSVVATNNVNNNANSSTGSTVSWYSYGYGTSDIAVGPSGNSTTIVNLPGSLFTPSR